MDRCGLRVGKSLREYQQPVVDEILKIFSEEKKKNVFISMPQGTGKTIIAIAALSELVNRGEAKNVLVLLPRRVLVDQWLDKTQEIFYGLSLMKNPTLSKMGIEKIKGWLKYFGALGMAMTAHSFKNFTKRGYLFDDDFDLVIVDEAADLVVAKDFVEGFRMSEWLKGLEEWKNRKIFLMPYHISERKIKEIVNKFGMNESALIRRNVPEAMLSHLRCTVHDPILIDDPVVDEFVLALQEHCGKIRANVNRILKKHGIKGHVENLETLLNPRTMERLKKIYCLDEETATYLQVMISKYILVQHLKKWFLYSNRKELERSILASQINVGRWLNSEDKKLEELARVVRSYLEKNYKVYIFSQYISSAEVIDEFLKKKLNLKPRDITLITGLDEDQFIKLDGFKRGGLILVSTPVFDKGTDIPEADAMIVYTPPLSIEKLFQVIGRIRGGDILFLAYRGFEQSIIEEVAEKLRKAFAEARGDSSGIDRNL